MDLFRWQGCAPVCPVPPGEPQVRGWPTSTHRHACQTFAGYSFSMVYVSRHLISFPDLWFGFPGLLLLTETDWPLSWLSSSITEGFLPLIWLLFSLLKFSWPLTWVYNLFLNYREVCSDFLSFTWTFTELWQASPHFPSLYLNFHNPWVLFLFFGAPKSIYWCNSTASRRDGGNRTRNIAVYTWRLSTLSYNRHPFYFLSKI
jgi:hypothetical protein